MQGRGGSEREERMAGARLFDRREYYESANRGEVDSLVGIIIGIRD